MSAGLQLTTIGILMLTESIAASSLHGIFKDSPSIAISIEAVRNVRNDTWTYELQKNSINGYIALAEEFTQNLARMGSRSHQLITDFTGVHLGLLKEAAEAQISLRKDRNITIKIEDLGNDPKIFAHRHKVEFLMKLIDLNFPREASVSVIVDQSILGEITVATILRKSLEKRRFATSNIIGKVILGHLRKHLLMLADTGANVVIVDCHKSIAAQILNAAAKIGMAGRGSDLIWFLTNRALPSPSSLFLIEENVFGIDSSIKRIPSINIPALLESAEKQKNNIPQSTERIKVKRLERSEILYLSSDREHHGRKLWKRIRFEGDIDLKALKRNEYKPLPRLRVAFAAPVVPYLMTINFTNTAAQSPFCTLHGKYGTEFVSSTSNATRPICAYGLSVDLLRYLEEYVGFVGDIQMVKDGRYGGYNETTKQPDGILGAIFRNEADIALDLNIDSTRRKFVDFTTPYRSFSYGMAFSLRRNQYDASYNRLGVFRPFKFALWMTILGTILGLALFIWAFERISPYGKYQKSQRNLKDPKGSLKIIDSINTIWGHFFSGEIIDEKPTTIAGRVTIVFVSCVSILVVSAYSANIIAFLVVSDDTPLITGLHDPKLEHLQVATLKSSMVENFLKYHSDVKIRKLHARMKLFVSFEECREALNSGKAQIIFYDYEKLHYEAAKNCSWHVVRATTEVTAIGLAFRKGSPWKRKLNTASLKLASLGITDVLYNSYLAHGVCPSLEFSRIGIVHLSNLFVLTAYGICCCIFIKLCICGWQCITLQLWKPRYAESNAASE